MHTILNNNRLSDHFPLISKQSLFEKLTLFEDQRFLNNIKSFNPYYFKNRNSNRLTVTLGDSWTWGSDVAGYQDFLAHQPIDWKISNGVASNINSKRLKQTYGNILSQEIQSDWLNLGIPGAGNTKIAKLVQNLSNVIPYLHYDRILIVVTLTEVGRWFNTQEDTHLDHAQLLQQLHSPDQLLEKLNQSVINQITNCLKNFSQVQLLVGTNFVDAIGLDSLQPDQRLDTPWYQLLQVSYDRPVYCATAWAWLNFARSIEDKLIPPELHLMFKSWIAEVSDYSYVVQQQLHQSPYFNQNSIYFDHPTSDGHKIWAEYILKNLSC